jgi:hypothetical protein
MPEILLPHHAQGQTPGFLAFAEGLSQAGHTVMPRIFIKDLPSTPLRKESPTLRTPGSKPSSSAA